MRHHRNTDFVDNHTSQNSTYPGSHLDCTLNTRVFKYISHLAYLGHLSHPHHPNNLSHLGHLGQWSIGNLSHLNHLGHFDDHSHLGHLSQPITLVPSVTPRSTEEVIDENHILEQLSTRFFFYNFLFTSANDPNNMDRVALKSKLLELISKCQSDDQLVEGLDKNKVKSDTRLQEDRLLG